MKESGHILQDKDLHALYHKAKNSGSLLGAIKEENVNYLDSDGYSLLEKACYNGQPRLVEILLKKRAKINDKTFEILAHSSKREESVEIFNILYKDYKNPNLVKIAIQAINFGNKDLSREIFDKCNREQKKEIQDYMVKEIKIYSRRKLNSDEEYFFKDILKTEIKEGNYWRVKELLEVYNEDQVNQQYDGKNMLTIAYEEMRDSEREIISLRSSDNLSEDDHNKIAKHKDKTIALCKIMNELLNNNSFEPKQTLQDNPGILKDIYSSSKMLLKSKDNKQIELGELQGELFSKLLKNNDTKGDLQNHIKGLLNIVVKNGDKKTYDIIANDSNFKEVDDLGNVPLLRAAQSGNIDVFKSVKKCSEVDTNKLKEIKNTQGTTVLMAACAGHNLEIVESILNDSEANAVDREGKNALHYLSTKPKGDNSSKITKVLLDKGVSIDHKDKNGLTPLMTAVINNNVELAKGLIERGANINAIDSQGNTALIYATGLNKKEMIETVLSANEVDVTHKNNRGVSAYLISSQRDWLQSDAEGVDATKDAMKEAIKNKQKEVEFEESAYPGLTQELLMRGADPYERESKSFVDAMLFSSMAMGLAKVGGVVADAIQDEKVIGASIASKIVRYGSSFFAGAVIADQNYQYAYDKLHSFFKGPTTDEKLSVKDKIMIGSIHDRGFGRVKYGVRLSKSIEAHGSFSEDSKDAIYNIAQLEDKIKHSKSDSSWVLNAHKDLTNQYIAVKNRIKTQPWYYTFPLVWKSKGLKNVASNILEAHKMLSDKVDVFKVSKAEGVDGNISEKTFDQVYSELIKEISSPDSYKQLLRTIVSNEDGDLDKLVRIVVNKEVLVSPKTYESFLKLDQDKRKVLQSEISKQSFLSKYSSQGGYKLAEKDLGPFQEKFKDLYSSVQEEQQKKRSSGVIGAVDRGMKDIARSNLDTTKQVMHYGASAYALAVEGLVWGATLSPEMKLQTANNIINLVAGPVSKAVVNVAGATLSTAGSALSTVAGYGVSLTAGIASQAWNNPEIAVGTVLVGGVMVAGAAATYHYAPQLKEMASNVMVGTKKLQKSMSNKAINIAPPGVKDIDLALDHGNTLRELGTKEVDKELVSSTVGNRVINSVHQRG